LSLDYCSVVKQRFNVSKAIKAQTLLSKLLSLEDGLGSVRRVAGLDVSYLKFNDLELGLGTITILNYPELELYKCYYATRRICIPYIPGLLAFREMEVLAPLLASVLDSIDVDLLLIDGHGIAHPRGFGIASHIGLAFNKPSIGVAKSLLAGREDYRGGKKFIVQGDRIVGGVLEVKSGKLYVSPGHKVSVETAVKLVESMIRPSSRLPEPTKLADVIGRELRRKVRGAEVLGVRECTMRTLPSLLDRSI
jgi:deoxyribonuclease V